MFVPRHTKLKKNEMMPHQPKKKLMKKYFQPTGARLAERAGEGLVKPHHQQADVVREAEVLHLRVAAAVLAHPIVDVAHGREGYPSVGLAASFGCTGGRGWAKILSYP